MSAPKPDRIYSLRQLAEYLAAINQQHRQWELIFFKECGRGYNAIIYCGSVTTRIQVMEGGAVASPFVVGDTIQQALTRRNQFNRVMQQELTLALGSYGLCVRLFINDGFMERFMVEGISKFP